jgi:proteasome lid subunit RPN8/RPN11
MPMARAILWNPMSHEGGPGARVSGRAPYPVFFQQEAVVALQEHLKASPEQAIFGFLAGDVFRDPEAGVLYAVIDKTLRLNQAIYGDKTEVVVARLWDRMQEQLARASGRLLGWYHSHPGHDLSLSTHDVETHEKYFTDPWHVAVLVAAQAEGVVGAFFRSSATASWAETPLPFYELLQPDSIRSDGKKRSFVTWKNYKAYNPVSAKRPSGSAAAPPPPAPPPPPPPPHAPAAAAATDDLPLIRTSADDEPAPHATRPAAPVFVPDEPPARRPSPPPPPHPPRSPESRAPRRTPAPSFKLLDQKPSARRRGRRRRGRWLTRLVLLLIVGGAAAAGYWYFVLGQRPVAIPAVVQRLLDRVKPAGTSPPTRPTARAPRSDTAFARFDRLSDTLFRAVRNYNDRAVMFANRQIDCAALARGLVAIENLWITYNDERRGKVASFDARRAARDQTLYAGVDSVEGQFERSRCRRP